MPVSNPLVLILLAPTSLLVGAVLQLVVSRFASARAKGALAVLFCLPSLISVAALVPAVRSGQGIDLCLAQWDGPLSLVLRVDALSVLFGFMGACIGALVLIYSIGYMSHDRAATRFFCTMLLFIGGFITLVFSANLFFLYLCWEVVGLCSFTLVGFWYTNAEAVAGARKVLLMTHIAGYGLLAATLVLYHRAGTALWTDPAIGRSFTGGIFALMLVALIAKSVQVPLHTWIPEAMAAPTPVSSLLHAACYVTAGVYLAARMHSFGPWQPAWSASLVWVGTVTMAVGVMYAMVQTDLKRMLAFSTVSQIGYMMLGLGIGTPLAIVAGLLHCLNHGFFKGGLFLNAGAVQHAAGTRDMNELGGLAMRMPRTTLWWLIGAGNMAGIPLMSGFVSKWMLYAAALDAGWAIPAVIAWAVSLGTVFLCAKATSAVFLGPLTEATRDAEEAPPSMQWGMGLMAAGAVVLGIAPQLAVNYLLNPVLSALSMGTAARVTWFGLFSGAGSFSTAGGLVLALVSLALGGIIYAMAHFARPAPAGAVLAGAGGVFTGGEPLGDRGRLTATDFSEIFAQDWTSFFRWTNVDRAYLAAGNVLFGAARRANRVVEWMERHAGMLLVIVSVALLVALRAIAPLGSAIAAQHLVRPPALLFAATGIAALALLAAAWAQPSCRRFALWMLLAAVPAVAGLAFTGAWLRMGLLELGTLLSTVLVWQTARTRSAARIYLAAVLFSAAFLAAGDWLAETHWIAWSQTLWLTSLAIKLAAIPLCFWLLRLADELPALVLGLIVAVLDMAAFGEAYVTAQLHPGLFMPQALWFGVAAATSLLAALLMLAQRSLKRLLVLSTIEDAGFLLLGLASASGLGAAGALAAAATHSMAKALLFISLNAPEAAGVLDGNPAALAARFPVSAFGFLFGMLAMLGVPPTFGYMGRWRLYEIAAQIHPALAAVFIVSSALALIAYALALTRAWWGPAAEDEAATREPPAARFVLAALAVLLLAGGLWPRLLSLLAGGAL
ncbi:MAG TPA: proton-conducting transporter membrane subunit [Terracidiphilus sp.]|nr:proton-conducting transporter membrane subunit [Terracidiphilus sp.]